MTNKDDDFCKPWCPKTVKFRKIKSPFKHGGFNDIYTVHSDWDGKKLGKFQYVQRLIKVKYEWVFIAEKDACIFDNQLEQILKKCKKLNLIETLYG